MSTYLVAFVVCEFVKITDISQHKINVSVIASKDKISQAKFALGAATKLMDFYTEFFGIPYPLKKQGMASMAVLLLNIKTEFAYCLPVN